MKKTIKNNKAITLIALVITIVILLILAAIMINITLGENGLFTKAKLGSKKMTNATITEKLGLVHTEYTVEKETGEYTGTFEQYLQSKGIIGEAVEDGKWQINVQNLCGRRLGMGNGNATIELADVYMLEKDENGYSIVYYGKSGTAPEVINTMGGAEEEKDESELLKAYFIDYHDNPPPGHMVTDPNHPFPNTAIIEDAETIENLYYISEEESLVIAYHSGIYKVKVAEDDDLGNTTKVPLDTKIIAMTMNYRHTFSTNDEGTTIMGKNACYLGMTYDEDNNTMKGYIYYNRKIYWYQQASKPGEMIFGVDTAVPGMYDILDDNVEPAKYIITNNYNVIRGITVADLSSYEDNNITYEAFITDANGNVTHKYDSSSETIYIYTDSNSIEHYFDSSGNEVGVKYMTQIEESYVTNGGWDTWEAFVMKANGDIDHQYDADNETIYYYTDGNSVNHYYTSTGNEVIIKYLEHYRSYEGVYGLKNNGNLDVTTEINENTFIPTTIYYSYENHSNYNFWDLSDGKHIDFQHYDIVHLDSVYYLDSNGQADTTRPYEDICLYSDITDKFYDKNGVILKTVGFPPGSLS